MTAGCGAYIVNDRLLDFGLELKIRVARLGRDPHELRSGFIRAKACLEHDDVDDSHIVMVFPNQPENGYQKWRPR